MSTPQPFLPPPADPALRRMAKCNVHTHLEGSIRPSTWLDLARGQGLAAANSLEAAEAMLQVDGRERRLVDYLEKISRTYPVLKSLDALRRTACEAAEDAAADGVIYFELRAGPATHAGAGIPIEAVIEALIDGLREAEIRLGIVARLIVAALRHHAPEVNLGLAHAAVRYRDQGVVGFDLAGDEAGFPAQQHAEAFAVARRGGLGITIHAGEAAGSANIDYAVRALGATRIGHGVRSVESESTVDMLERRRVLLEICPTSNVHTGAVAGIGRHPVRRLYDRGVPIAIGDDDPVTSRTSVSRELTLLQQQFGFTREELAGIQTTTLEASFLRDSDPLTRLRAALSGDFAGVAG